MKPTREEVRLMNLRQNVFGGIIVFGGIYMLVAAGALIFIAVGWLDISVGPLAEILFIGAGVAVVCGAAVGFRSFTTIPYWESTTDWFTDIYRRMLLPRRVKVDLKGEEGCMYCMGTGIYHFRLCPVCIRPVLRAVDDRT